MSLRKKKTKYGALPIKKKTQKGEKKTRSEDVAGIGGLVGVSKTDKRRARGRGRRGVGGLGRGHCPIFSPLQRKKR